MTEIATVEQLAALPVRSEVVDKDDWTWIKLAPERWQPFGGPGSSSQRLFSLWSPVRLANEPPELRMTRCCGHHCMTTTPLPVGASWLCVEHGGEPIDTRGN